MPPVMGALNDHSSLDAQEDLSTQFEKSAASVRHVIERVDQKYVGPGRQTASHFFSTNPVISTFAVVFFSLSLLPIVSFLILSTFITASVFILALGVALTISISVILFLGGLLVLSVFIAFLSSFFVTFFVLLAWVLSLSIFQRKLFPRRLSDLSRETRALFGVDESINRSISAEDVKQEDADNERNGDDDTQGTSFLSHNDAPKAVANGNRPESSVKEEGKQEQDD